MEQNSNIIEIEHLDKHFDDIHAVNDLSFRVKRGELFAFLGLNGAGKSTTISMMCGQLAKDGGTVTIDGHNLDQNVDQIKKELGVVFQYSGLDQVLSVYDNLKYRAGLYGIKGKDFETRYKEMAKLLEFENLEKRIVGKLSGGQKRRIDIARALLHKPKILILDEPTTGLDPQTRKLVWNVIDHLRKEEHMTIFLTTHYMEEAVDADYLVIIKDGQIAAEGTPIELKNKYTGDFISLYGVTEEQVKKLCLSYEKIGQMYRVEVENTSYVTALIQKHPELFVDYEITKGKMDDVFLSVTGTKLTGGENA